MHNWCVMYNVLCRYQFFVVHNYGSRLHMLSLLQVIGRCVLHGCDAKFINTSSFTCLYVRACVSAQVPDSINAAQVLSTILHTNTNDYAVPFLCSHMLTCISEK